MNKKSNPLIKLIVIPIVVIMLGIGFIALLPSGSHKLRPQQQKKQIVGDSATGDTPVETLKTLTAEVAKVEEQNKKLISENKDLKDKSKQELLKWKSDLLAQVKTKLEGQTKLSGDELDKIHKKLKAIEQGKGSENFPIDVGDGSDGQVHQFVWVSDMVAHSSSDSTFAGNSSGNSSGGSLLNEASSVLNPGVKAENSGADNQEPPIPYYTLPKNTFLTGAVLMQPLIGRIPIDGKVPDPYEFSAVLGPDSIAANGQKIPSNIKGIIVSGIATGDMLRKCARGTIDSMTFIFPDGRISTTTAKDGNHLGLISNTHGDQCLAGSFHSNALEYLGGTAGLSFLQGYANALSQAQTDSTYYGGSGLGPSISTIVKNGNTYALGQGASQAAQSAIQWWNQRVQSSFDYVEVANVTEQGRPVKLNIKITKEVDIDYDPNGRKVYYAHNKNAYKNKKLD